MSTAWQAKTSSKFNTRSKSQETHNFALCSNHRCLLTGSEACLERNQWYFSLRLQKLIHLSFAVISQDLLAFVHMSLGLGIFEKLPEFMDVSIDGPLWWTNSVDNVRGLWHLFNHFIYELFLHSRKCNDLSSRMMPSSLKLLNQVFATNSLTVPGTSWTNLPLPFGCLKWL